MYWYTMNQEHQHIQLKHFIPSGIQKSLTVDPTKTYRVYLATVTTDDTVSASNEVFVPLQT